MNPFGPSSPYHNPGNSGSASRTVFKLTGNPEEQSSLELLESSLELLGSLELLESSLELLGSLELLESSLELLGSLGSPVSLELLESSLELLESLLELLESCEEGLEFSTGIFPVPSHVGQF